uniref:DUF4794 domain-containing protein n=1 Tax=Anopheles dirus TaxID=7168 RepID=A0A182N2L2_9DIPT
MTTSIRSGLYSALGTVLLAFATLATAIPAGPGIEINPAAFSEDGKLNYLVVDDKKVQDTGSQDVVMRIEASASRPEPPVVYQRPVVVQQQQQQQQPQYQYQESPQYQQQQPTYQMVYQQPSYQQVMQYPAQTYYSGGPPPGYAPYNSQPGTPYYASDAGPPPERGGILSNLLGIRPNSYSPESSARPSGTGISAGTALLGAALLFG